MYESGLTIDSWMNLSNGMFAVAAYAFSLSRSGPIVPVELAGANVWHAAQPFAANAALPAARLAPPPAGGGVAPVVVGAGGGGAAIVTPFCGPTTAAT